MMEKEVRQTEILFVNAASCSPYHFLGLLADRYRNGGHSSFQWSCNHLFLKDLSCAAFVNLFYDFLEKSHPMLLTFFY
jgi:hypothetical protein